MANQKRPARGRVVRVSFYHHRGSWYLYCRDAHGIHRPRVGRSEAEAERVAGLKNAELVADTTAAPSPPSYITPTVLYDLDRRAFVDDAPALLSGFLQLGPDTKFYQAQTLISADAKPPVLQVHIFDQRVDQFPRP